MPSWSLAPRHITPQMVGNNMVTASPPSPCRPLYIDIRPYGQHLPCIIRMRNKVNMYKVFVQI